MKRNSLIHNTKFSENWPLNLGLQDRSFQIEVSLIPIFKIILYITIIITETTRFNKVTTKVNTLYLFDAATKLDPTLKKIRKSRNEKINIQLKAPL